MCPRRGLVAPTESEVFPSSLLGPSTRLPLSAGPLGETEREALRESRARALFASGAGERLVHCAWEVGAVQSNPGKQPQLVFKRGRQRTRSLGSPAL